MGRGEDIVLIEDDARVADQLRPEIERVGYRCRWAASATAGLAELERRLPDLLLLDLMLPDRSGFEVLAQVRQRWSLPVIVLTARGLGEDKVRALHGGADDYVTKPFWTEELTARIAAVLRRQRVARGPRDVERFGRLELDRTAQRVSREGVPLALTPTEYDLLDFFLRRPTQALRRERIIDQVLRGEDSASEALQAQISRLRKKLGPEGRCIVTVRGIGYRFDPDRAPTSS